MVSGLDFCWKKKILFLASTLNSRKIQALMIEYSKKYKNNDQKKILNFI